MFSLWEFSLGDPLIFIGLVFSRVSSPAGSEGNYIFLVKVQVLFGTSCLMPRVNCYHLFQPLKMEQDFRYPSVFGG